MHTGFDGRPVRKRPLERPCRRWENDIKIDFKEVGWELFNLAEDRNWCWDLWMR